MTEEYDDSSDDERRGVQAHSKVILLGDGAVGKTSLAVRFASDKFETQYKQTGPSTRPAVSSRPAVPPQLRM